MKKYVAEAFGTFALVFAGTGDIIVNDVSQGAITHAARSLFPAAAAFKRQGVARCDFPTQLTVKPRTSQEDE